MKSFIRWLAAAEIHDARMAGYRDAVGDCADVIRAQAAREPPGREAAAAVLTAVADGLEDAFTIVARTRSA